MIIVHNGLLENPSSLTKDSSTKVNFAQAGRTSADLLTPEPLRTSVLAYTPEGLPANPKFWGSKLNRDDSHVLKYSPVRWKVPVLGYPWSAHISISLFLPTSTAAQIEQEAKPTFP